MNFKFNFKYVTIFLGFILIGFIFQTSAAMVDRHPNLDWTGLGDYIMLILFGIMVACNFEDLNK